MVFILVLLKVHINFARETCFDGKKLKFLSRKTFNESCHFSETGILIHVKIVGGINKTLTLFFSFKNRV